MLVAVPERTMQLNVMYQDHEQKLTSTRYSHPKGDPEIACFNDEEWIKVLKPLLVDWDTAQAIVGEEATCSPNCCDEDLSSYKFVDKSRFKLYGCVHYSHHVQC